MLHITDATDVDGELAVAKRVQLTGEVVWRRRT
jgi:hypothetical protein